MKNVGKQTCKNLLQKKNQEKRFFFIIKKTFPLGKT
jgi:hypothetical protein